MNEIVVRKEKTPCRKNNGFVAILFDFGRVYGCLSRTIKGVVTGGIFLSTNF